jgi:hypothetical protein
MFTKAFASQVLSPSAQGEPGFVKGPIHFGINLFLTSPAIFNGLFALTQLTIGGLILYKRSVKLGLILSVIWGAIVWVFGEAYGGIFSGHTLLLMGAPGAVLLYVVLALAVMPGEKEESPKHNQVAYWLVIIWAIFWIGGGIYQLLPGQNTTSDISSMLSSNAESAPKWLSSLDNGSAKLVKDAGGSSKHIETSKEMDMTSSQMANMSSPVPTIITVNSGYWFIILLAFAQIYIGVAALLPGLWRISAIYLGIVLSLIFWIVGQDIGGLYCGLATDPSTGPLFVLMGLAILSSKDINKKLKRVGHTLAHLTVGAR